MRCGDCKFWEREWDISHHIEKVEWLGHCARWYEGYYTRPEITSRDVLVENDEGWGNIVGADFGCVLFESRGTDERSEDDA